MICIYIDLWLYMDIWICGTFGAHVSEDLLMCVSVVFRCALTTGGPVPGIPRGDSTNDAPGALGVCVCACVFLSKLARFSTPPPPQDPNLYHPRLFYNFSDSTGDKLVFLFFI